MADIELAIYARLKATTAVTNLIGGATVPRIYPNIVPQDAPLPAIAYQRISAYRRLVMEGPATLIRPRVQLTILASTYSAAKSLAAACREALDGYKGTAGGVKVGVTMAEDESDEYGSSNLLHVVRQDYLIWHSE